MSDFLMRLAQRTLGVADVMHPAIPSIFSPGLEINSTGISPVQSNTSINSVSEAPTPSFNESILPNNPNLKTSPPTPLLQEEGSKYTSPFFEGNSVRGLDFSHNVKSQILDHRATPSISSASEAPTSYASKSILPNNFNIRKIQAATETNFNNNLAQINHSNQLKPVITSESSSILDYKTTPTLVELNNLSSSINRVSEAPTSYTTKNILPDNSSLGTVEAAREANFNNNLSQINQAYQLNPIITNESTRIFNHQTTPTLVELNKLSTSINRVLEAPTSYTTKNILPDNSSLGTVEAATETNFNNNLSQINQAYQLNPIITNESTRIFNHQTTPTLVELNKLFTSINRVSEAPTSYTSNNILPNNSSLGTVEAATETNFNNNLSQINQAYQLNPIITNESTRIFNHQTKQTLVELNNLSSSINRVSEAPTSYTTNNILSNNSSLGTVEAATETNFNNNLSHINQANQLNPIITNESTRIFNHQTKPTLVELNKLSTSINRVIEAPTSYTTNNILPNNSSLGTVEADIKTNLYPFNMKLQITKSPQPPLIRGAKNKNVHPHIKMVLGNQNSSQVNQSNQLNSVVTNELTRIFNHQTTPTLVELNKLSTSINRVLEAPTSYTNKNILPNNSSTGAVQAATETNLVKNNLFQINQSNQQLHSVIIKELTRTVDHPNAQNSNLIPPLLRGVRGDQKFEELEQKYSPSTPLVPITPEATPPTPRPRLPSPSQSIKVSIGRIDVQNTPAHSPEPERRRTNKSHPKCGLKDYLKRREGRSK